MNQPNSQKDWFCIRTKIGSELQAIVSLSYLSGEVQAAVGTLEFYFPRIRKLMPVGGQKRSVLTALFPGYFFARFDLARAARFVTSRPGVLGVVRFGEQPAAVPANVIEELKSMDFENTEQFLNPFPFVPGQRLLVTEGPFAGFEAEYVSSLNGGQRALLLLEYLHRRINVIASASILELAC